MKWSHGFILGTELIGCSLFLTVSVGSSFITYLIAPHTVPRVVSSVSFNRSTSTITWTHFYSNSGIPDGYTITYTPAYTLLGTSQSRSLPLTNSITLRDLQLTSNVAYEVSISAFNSAGSSGGTNVTITRKRIDLSCNS